MSKNSHEITPEITPDDLPGVVREERQPQKPTPEASTAGPPQKPPWLTVEFHGDQPQQPTKQMSPKPISPKPMSTGAFLIADAQPAPTPSRAVGGSLVTDNANKTPPPLVISNPTEDVGRKAKTRTFEIDDAAQDVERKVKTTVLTAPKNVVTRSVVRSMFERFGKFVTGMIMMHLFIFNDSLCFLF